MNENELYWARNGLGMWLDALEAMLFWLDGGPPGWMTHDHAMKRFFIAAEWLAKTEASLGAYLESIDPTAKCSATETCRFHATGGDTWLGCGADTHEDP